MLIRGTELTTAQRRIVRSAFVYRLTTENGYPERNPTGARVPAISDNQWIAEHAFHFIKDGSRLSGNHRYAEPAFMADKE